MDQKGACAAETTRLRALLAVRFLTLNWIKQHAPVFAITDGTT